MSKTLRGRPPYYEQHGILRHEYESAKGEKDKYKREANIAWFIAALLLLVFIDVLMVAFLITATILLKQTMYYEEYKHLISYGFYFMLAFSALWVFIFGHRHDIPRLNLKWLLGLPAP